MEYQKLTRGSRHDTFEQLYNEHYDKIYIYIYRRVNCRHTAEDLTAEVFLKAFANPYNPQLAKFSTYIFKIASNILKNYYRSVSYLSKIIDSEELSENLSDKTDILEEIITLEEYTQLKETLTTLSRQQYNVIYRRYYLDQSFKEIGEALHITDTYARKIHERALSALNKAIEHEYSEKPETSLITCHILQT